jgi:hypothetical protein
MLVAVATPKDGEVSTILLAERPLGSAVENDGTPLPLALKTPLFVVTILPNVPALS